MALHTHMNGRISPKYCLLKPALCAATVIASVHVSRHMLENKSCLSYSVTHTPPTHTPLYSNKAMSANGHVHCDTKVSVKCEHKKKVFLRFVIKQNSF